MELNEIKKIKRDTELKILELIRDFTDSTGLSVSDIKFNYATAIGIAQMHSPLLVEITVFI